MVRFKDGQPIALHLSAHADGHSWGWKTVEKMGKRPVGYVATGSRELSQLKRQNISLTLSPDAMYGKPG